LETSSEGREVGARNGQIKLRPSALLQPAMVVGWPG
jgi:hypothetical protein